MMPRRPLLGSTSDQRLTTTIAIPAAAHLILAVLDAIGRAAYGGRARDALGMAADHPAWTVMHLVMAVTLTAVIVTERARGIALCLSGSVLVGWSALMLAWGLQLAPPVSLVGPLLGLLVGAGTWALADAWAIRE